MRHGDWKFLFTKQDRWFNGVQDNLTSPVITNLRLDPFERFQQARGFDEWQENRSWTIAPAIAKVQEFFVSFKKYPPRQPSMEANIDVMIQQLMQANNP